MFLYTNFRFSYGNVRKYIIKNPMIPLIFNTSVLFEINIGVVKFIFCRPVAHYRFNCDFSDIFQKDADTYRRSSEWTIFTYLIVFLYTDTRLHNNIII